VQLVVLPSWRDTLAKEGRLIPSSVGSLARNRDFFENVTEPRFSSHRYHECRASSCKVDSPGLVVMGSVRVVSGLATQLRPEEGLQLRSGFLEQWQQVRAGLEKRRQTRCRQRQFRQDPEKYLHELEQLYLQLSLLS